MKRLPLFFLLCGLLSSFATLFAQTPNGIPYQGVARSSGGAILSGQPIRVRFTIRDSVATGNIVYRETFTLTTDNFGLFNVHIGTGTAVSGTFSGINWGRNAKFMQVEMDPTGVSSYVNMGTQQMMSVPYAKYAETSGAVISTGGSGFTHYIGELWGGGIVYHIYKDSANVEHGLIMSVRDLAGPGTAYSSGVQWGCYNTTTGAVNMWNGAINTPVISSACGAATPARLCDTFSSGGYTDWYLPSITELQLIFQNQYDIQRAISTISGAMDISINYYWSSTELSSPHAYLFYFYEGRMYSQLKNQQHCVRAIRKF